MTRPGHLALGSSRGVQDLFTRPPPSYPGNPDIEPKAQCAQRDHGLQHTAQEGCRTPYQEMEDPGCFEDPVTVKCPSLEKTTRGEFFRLRVPQPQHSWTRTRNSFGRGLCCVQRLNQHPARCTILAPSSPLYMKLPPNMTVSWERETSSPPQGEKLCYI